MKVIDLLNKIANEDEIPEKIKYEKYIYWYDKNLKDYQNAQVEFRSYLISSKYHNTDFLNDEVEIIEDKKIEKINKLYKYKEEIGNDYFENILKVYDGGEYEIKEDMSFVIDKINEIIDKINREC